MFENLVFDVNKITLKLFLLPLLNCKHSGVGVDKKGKVCITDKK